MQSTAGQYLVNSILPKKYRDPNRVFSNSELMDLLEQLQQELPKDEYKRVLHDMYKIGGEIAYQEGSSFSLKDLKTPPKVKMEREKIYNGIQQILELKVPQSKKEDMIVNLLADATDILTDNMYQEALGGGSGLASQIASKTRGKPADLRSLILGDLLMADGKGKPIPVPILHGYAEGVDPAEYWANTYGTRQGVISVKMATADAGFLSKKLKQLAHKQVITMDDCETTRGIMVDAGDRDNIGAVLAEGIGGYEAGRPISTTMLKRLKGKELYVRSPISCDAPDGVCSKCAGIRETGRFPEIGDNLGMPAAQSIGEKVTQTALSAKHGSGRTSGKKDRFVSGFKLIEQLLEVPKSFTDAATISSVDGIVDKIHDAPQGGKYVYVDGEEFYVPEKMDVQVKVGDRIEAGDLLSDGIPNPADLVKYKGIGETRRLFINQLRDVTGANRRNVELLSKGFIDFVKVHEPDTVPNAAPDDIIKYSELLKTYKPREGFRDLSPNMAVGQYLETPQGHYTIGTKVTKNVARELSNRGVKKLTVHADAPPFDPVMVPSVRGLMNSNDWQERLGGYHLKDSLLGAASSGMKSQVHGYSYIPGIMRAEGFGKDLKETGKY